MPRVRSVFAALLALAGTATAQPPAADVANGFTLPEDRDSKQRLAAITDYLAKASVPWDVVCTTAQQLLDGKSDSFTALPTGGRVSVKGRVSDLLGGLPKDGKQFYELTYGPPATELLKQATAKGYDRAKLAELAQRYFHTKAGTQAAVLLASLQLDAGEAAEAAYGFRRLLARPDADEWAGPWLVARAAAAYKRTGDPRLAGDADRLLDRLERTAPHEGLAVGRKTLTADDLRRQVSEVVARSVRAGEENAGRYGNPSHTGRGAAGSPFLDPTFAVPLLYRTEVNKDGADWVREKLGEVYKQLDPGKGQVAVPGFFPVTVPGLVVYRGYDAVYAVATRDGYTAEGVTYKAGQLVWLSPMKYGAQSLYGGDDRAAAKAMVDAWQSYWQRAGRVLVENTQTGALAHDGKRVYCVDDWAVPPAPPQFNQIGAFNPIPAGAQARGAGDFSRLCAIDLSTGNAVWWLGGVADAPTEEDKQADAQRLTDNALFLGPPVAANGKLYTLFERDGQVLLACLNPDRLLPTTANPNRPPLASSPVTSPQQPELVWVQGLGSPATKLTAAAERRTHACFPAFADGVLVCPTHAGAVVAVDVTARTLLWAKGYAALPDPGKQIGEGGVIGMPVPGRGRPNPRMVPEPGALAAASADRWRAAAPIISDGKVVLVAPDADQMLCLDLRTGEQLWADPRRKDDLYVGGVVDGVVLVVGKTGVRAVKLNEPVAGKPSEAWPMVSTGTPSGHGTTGSDGVYYLPLAAGGSGPADAAEPQVWAIDAATGAVKAKTSFRRPDPTADPRRAIGNLVFHEGLLLAQSADALTAFPLLDLKQQEMARRLKADATDPRGLMLRGELALDAGDLKTAVADFRSAAGRNPPDDLKAGLRQKLYVAYTELLRADFSAAEGFLADYETLCRVTADGDDLAERQKAADESARRRGLYLSLVARGREKQGRFNDAVAAYLEFAGLSDGKPTAVVGESVSAIRPDVWAEGRLTDLLATAPAAARKQLADKAEAEWTEVKKAGDLVRLRRFVAGYGPHLPAGKAAAVELAGKLLDARNPADRREALALLMRLTADPDPAARAAATDRLAAALAAGGQPEHAVGLYGKLGGEFKGVSVKPGQTGGERLAGLLADRRLLSHLEPGRSPLAGRYSVDVQPSTPALGGLPAVGVRIDGPLLPSLRSIRLAFHQGGNGDNRWVLAVTDGRTGEELMKLADLQQPPGAGGPFGATPAEPTALASGHLLLFVLGTNAHCLDLLEKKEVWRYPLLGRAPPHANLTVSHTADGDSEYSFDDGFKLRLGRAAVLRPGYAALVTRDGLVCLDPATRQTRWERADVSSRVQVWGDDRHLFLVETDAQGAHSSRVLRAADGAAVATAPDFAAKYMDAGRRAVLGRHLLLDSGSGTAPRTLRLYDPLTGADAWSVELPDKAVLVDSTDRVLTGAMTEGGRVVLYDTATGKTVLDTTPTADGRPLLANTRPLLVADADRLFLFGNSIRVEPARLAMNAAVGQPTVRQATVNGPAVAFDRATGAVLWHSDRLFVGRTLVTERFDELPALVTCSDQPLERPGEATRAALVRVEVIDKATGRVRFHGGYPNAGPFHTAVANPKAHAIDLIRPDVRVRLAPDAGR